jgi:capsular exopolysaccharide synthesis family protein
MFDTQELRATGGPADAAPTLPLPPSGQQVHLLDRLNAIFKHRRIAGTTFALVVGFMMIQSYSTIPTYRTSAQVEISDERSTSIGAIGVPDPLNYQAIEAYYTTQYQIMRSREVGRRVVRRLKLVDHPLFSGSGPVRRDPLSLLRQVRTGLTSWVRGLVSRPAETPATAAAQTPAAREEAVISALMSGVTIVPIEFSLLVNIVYQHHDPQFAALAANTIAEEYVAQNLEKRLEATTNTLRWIEKELAGADQRARETEDALAQYREDRNAQSLEDRTNVVVTRLNELNTQWLGAQAALRTASNNWNQVASARPTDDSADLVPLIGMAEDVVKARGEVNRLVAEQSQLGQRYGENHELMRKLKISLENAQQELVAARFRVKESYRSTYDSARHQESQLAQSFQAQTASVAALDKKAAEYNGLKRQSDASRELHKSLITEYQKVQIAANSKANNVKLMDRAQPPAAPITPDTRRDLVTAILAGLTLALGLAFGLEYLDDTVKTPDDVTKRLGLPLLGLLPSVRGDRVPLLTEAVPHDFGEAFRSLRTSLVFSSSNEHARIIGVTSSQPLEGKTTTACNISLALALAGSRVLLIDADMRRPALHRAMGLPNVRGLSHLLVGQSRVREVVQRTREPNLFVVTAGPTPPNPSELLGSDRMNQLLANLATGPFEWVVIDTPPVLAVTDAAVLAPKLGGVVFVIGSEMTRRVHAERALDSLRAGRTRGIGAVLNRVDLDRNKYYYARYYGYQYKSYYGQNQVSA